MLIYTGFLKVKKETRQVSDKFKLREFVVTDNAQSYPQTILFQVTQDRCSLLDDIKVGDEISITFNLKGREWKNPQGEIKIFNSLDAFRIEKIGKQKPQQEETYRQEEPMLAPDDDLPF